MLIRDQAGRTAKLALYSGIAWLFVAAGSGLAAVLAAAGIVPAPVADLQPVFLNAFLFGWIAMGGTALGLFIIQRTHGVPLHNESLGQFSVWIWNIANAGGLGALMMGMGSAGPFRGYIWPLQLLWLAGLLLLLFNVARTVNRVPEPMFASTSYFLAALAWGGAVYFAGNGLWLPGGFGVNPLAALFQGMYAQSVVWLWAVPLGAGAALYAAAAASGRPLYSRQLANVGLWGLALHAATGVQRPWGAAVPEWVQATSVGAGALTVVATLALFINVTRTVGEGPQAGAVYATPSGRALRFGTWLLAVTGVLAALQPLSLFQPYIQGTQWSVAPHLTALLGATLLMFAGLYELLPMLRQPKDRPDELLYDLKVAGRHVKLSCWGAGLMTAGLWAGGTLQVLARSSFGAGANLAGAAAPALLLQAAGLALLLAGQLFFVGIVAKAAAVRGRVELPVVVTDPSGE